MTAPWLIAHQGGWDEILLFVAPVVLAILGVRWAERRGRARRQTPPAGDGDAAGIATVTTPNNEDEP